MSTEGQTAATPDEYRLDKIRSKVQRTDYNLPGWLNNWDIREDFKWCIERIQGLLDKYEKYAWHLPECERKYGPDRIGNNEGPCTCEFDPSKANGGE